jgi:hypothetical protein
MSAHRHASTPPESAHPGLRPGVPSSCSTPACRCSAISNASHEPACERCAAKRAAQLSLNGGEYESQITTLPAFSKLRQVVNINNLTLKNTNESNDFGGQRQRIRRRRPPKSTKSGHVPIPPLPLTPRPPPRLKHPSWWEGNPVTPFPFPPSRALQALRPSNRNAVSKPPGEYTGRLQHRQSSGALRATRGWQTTPTARLPLR